MTTTTSEKTLSKNEKKVLQAQDQDMRCVQSGAALYVLDGGDMSHLDEHHPNGRKVDPDTSVVVTRPRLTRRYTETTVSVQRLKKS
jgi:hypothetical protein